MRAEQALAIAEKALKTGGASWSYADEEQSAALGLPPQTGGWGLLIFFEVAAGQEVTAACERPLVASLEEREGDVDGWASRVHYWAEGTPGGLGAWDPPASA